jgi:hypothetical protein
MFSRIIKYLVIRTRKYSAYDLNDMRLHAIGLYAGQDTSVEESEESDGTESVPDADIHEAEVQLFFTDVLAFLTPTWKLENFWPWLHLNTTEPPDTDFVCNLHVSVDILQTFRIHSFNVSTSSELTRTPEEIEQDGEDFWSHLLDFIVRFAGHAALAFTIGLTGRAIDSCSILILNLGTLAILFAMLIAWVVLISAYLTWLDYAVTNGILHPWSAASSILFLIAGLFTGLVITSLTNSWGVFKHFMEWYDIGHGISGLYPKDWFAVTYTIVSLVFKITILLSLCSRFAKFYAMGCAIE